MKKVVSVILVIVSTFMLLGLQGCTNTKPSMGPGAMRIWLAPSHRSATEADTDGNIYIKVNSQ